VQLLAQIGDGVQTAETKGSDRGVGRSEEIFERPVDGVLLRRRALLCIPLVLAFSSLGFSLGLRDSSRRS
jgi:hypothetical protein